MLTRQIIYDRVRDHLLKQNCRAIDGAKCLYRGRNGTKCAIGALIPDSCYRPEFDFGSKGIHVLLGIYTPIDIFGEELAPDVSIPFLQNIQAIHDNTYVKVSEWPLMLTEFAKAHELIP